MISRQPSQLQKKKIKNGAKEQAWITTEQMGHIDSLVERSGRRKNNF